MPVKRFLPELSVYRFVVAFALRFLERLTGPRLNFPKAGWFEMIIVGFIDGEFQCRIQNLMWNT